jgi:hypothetical protein
MRCLPCVVLALLLPSAGGAQAWVPEAERAYVRLAQGFASAEERFDAEGRVVPYNATTGETVRDRSLYLYAEVGLGRGLGLVGSFPYRRVTLTDPSPPPPVEHRAFGWGTAVLGARYDLGAALGLPPDGADALALTVAAGLPLGYTRNLRPAVGTGQVDVQLALDLGRSLWPFPGYVQGRLGYRRRTGLYALSTATPCERDVDPDGRACLPDAEARRDYGDEFVFGGEAGVQGGPFLLQVLLDGTWSATRPESEPVGAPPEAFVRQRLLRAGAGVAVYGPAGVGLGVQVFAPAHAQNALKATEWVVGLEKRF